jgi:hypothetical protein
MEDVECHQNILLYRPCSACHSPGRHHPSSLRSARRRITFTNELRQRRAASVQKFTLLPGSVIALMPDTTHEETPE